MAWFRLDDQGAFHAKVIAAGNEAYGAWCRAGQWSSLHLTEGRIPRATALTIARQKIWERLVASGLCVSLGDDGYQIHDFLDWNPSAAEVLAKREARADAGRKGGIRRGESRRPKQPAKQVPSIGQANDQAKGEAIASAKTKQNSTPIPIPIPIPRDPPLAPPGGKRGQERIVDVGTAAMSELFAVYEGALTSALGRTVAVPNDRTAWSHLALAVNVHLRGDETVRGALAEVQKAVAEWVDEYRERAHVTAGWAPKKFLDWLNAERSARRDPEPPPRAHPAETESKSETAMTDADRARNLARIAELAEGGFGGKFV